MKIQSAIYQNNNKKQNFGMIRVIGDNTVAQVIRGTAMSLGDKNFRAVSAKPFTNAPFQGLRQFFISGAIKTEEKLVKALRENGHKPFYVPHKGPFGASQSEFENFIEDYHINF